MTTQDSTLRQTAEAMLNGLCTSGIRIKRMFPIGTRFGRWTVIGESDSPDYLECLCECGQSKRVSAYKLRRGHTHSCGCLRRDEARKSNQTHGATVNGILTPEFRAWSSMLTRCCNPKNKGYKNYGARGILVCPEWRNSFASFLADMGARPTPKHSIDRIDNDGHYSPENCRWSTGVEQNRNRRSTVRLTFNGSTKSASEWASITGLTIGMIRKRIADGWTHEQVLGTPRLRQRFTFKKQGAR